MLMVVLLFGTATAFSQTYVISVDWDNDECGCLDQGNSYYGVKYQIYDTENDIIVNAGTEVRVDFGTYEVDIEVPEVNAHCASYLNAKYLVKCRVAVFCDSSPPGSICMTELKVLPEQTCTDFANGIGFSFDEFFMN